MGYKEDAELVVKHIDTMEKAGGSLLDKAGAYNPLLAVFTAGAKEWVADNGTQAAKTYVEYKGMLYYVAAATQRFEQYNPETATNNYWVIPRPVAGVFPYVSGMMVIKEMQVLDPNGKTYLCTLQSGEYKLVNPPSEAASIFTEI